jgi:hypothetical protein
VAPVQKIKTIIKTYEINITKMNRFSFSISSVNRDVIFNLSHNTVTLMSVVCSKVYQMSNKKDSSCIYKYINIICRYNIKSIKTVIDNFARLKHKLSIVNCSTHHNVPKMFNTAAKPKKKKLSRKRSSDNKLLKL